MEKPFYQRFDRNHRAFVSVIRSKESNVNPVAEFCENGLIVESEDQDLIDAFRVDKVDFGNELIDRVLKHREGCSIVLTIRLIRGKRTEVRILDEDFPSAAPDKENGDFAGLAVLTPHACEAFCIQQNWQSALLWLRSNVAARLEAWLNSGLFEAQYTGENGEMQSLGLYASEQDALEAAVSAHPECCFVEDEFDLEIIEIRRIRRA